jgi:hypothetical protein
MRQRLSLGLATAASRTKKGPGQAGAYLRQLGWTVGAGGNIQVDYRFPGTNIDQIRADVAEIVGLQPDLIAHGTPGNKGGS